MGIEVVLLMAENPKIMKDCEIKMRYENKKLTKFKAVHLQDQC